MSIKFLVLRGGGYFGFFWGGGSADFIFMGAGIFLIRVLHQLVTYKLVKHVISSPFQRQLPLELFVTRKP